MDLDLDPDETVHPRKLYISEAAMSNHFARMNITHLWNSPVKPASTPTPTTSEAFTTVNTESLISPIASQSELRTSDLDDSESEENTDRWVNIF